MNAPPAAAGAAVLLTGRPASGKTTLARALLAVLRKRGLPAVHLESDALREALFPEAGYTREERDRFYAALARLAALLAAQGLAVVLDATAPRRAHRDLARAALPGLFEVYVSTPLEICAARDPKGLYRLARAGSAPHLPGAGEPYEEPSGPDLVVREGRDPESAAEEILARLAVRCP